MVYKLSKEEQEVALTLANHIDAGIVQYDTVLKEFRENIAGSAPLIHFWYHHSKETRQLVDNLYNYGVRKHLERCYRVS